MIKAAGSPFESKYGFKGTNFSVDAAGNLIAASINIAQDSGVTDFILTDDAANFFIDSYTDPNPPITLERGKTYTFKLNLTNFSFYLRDSDQTTLLETGLRHSTGSTGAAAQGKTSGTLSFTVPNDSSDTIYYTDQNKLAIGTISVIDPVGLFGSINLTGNINATSATTGSLVVAGGIGVSGDLYIDGNFNVGGTGIPVLYSETNLDLNAKNKIVLKVNDFYVGSIDSSGLTIPINNSTITSSSFVSGAINGTVIGNITPSTANFTSGTVSSTPSGSTDISNKNYVDLTATALAIAFGL